MIKHPRVRLVHTLPEVPEYQERPQIEQLREFWQSDTLRVSALIGISGAGKTALVRRFLEELPGSAVVNPRVPKRADLSSPDGLFVWSFYSAPYPEEFFTETFNFIRACAPASATLPDLEKSRRATVFMVEEALCKVPLRFLFVLDGLEKMQFKGNTKGEPGSLMNVALKRFLIRVAEGCGNAKVLITTRYQLPDLQRYSKAFKDGLTDQKFEKSFQMISVDALEVSAAVALLRALGVHGDDVLLSSIAKETGQLAFPTYLVGCWLRDYYEGDARQYKRSPSFLIDNILNSYVQKLSDLEKWILEALSIYDIPCAVNFLLDLINECHRNKWSYETLLNCLKHLCSLGVVQKLYVEGEEQYTVHPLIRGCFASRLEACRPKTREISLYTALVFKISPIKELESALDTEGIDPILSIEKGKITGVHIPGHRWLLKALIYNDQSWKRFIRESPRKVFKLLHLLASVWPLDAFKIFINGLSGYHYVGCKLGLYSESIELLHKIEKADKEGTEALRKTTELFKGAKSTLMLVELPRLALCDRMKLYNELGMFYHLLGNLWLALQYFEKHLRYPNLSDDERYEETIFWILSRLIDRSEVGNIPNPSAIDPNAHICAMNVFCDMGRLRIVQKIGVKLRLFDNDIMKRAEEDRLWAQWIASGLAPYAEALADLGYVKEAENVFSRMRLLQYMSMSEELRKLNISSAAGPFGWAGMSLAKLLLRIGELEKAQNINSINMKVCKLYEDEREEVHCQLLDSESRLIKGQLQEVREALEKVQQWYKRSGDMKLSIYSGIIFSKLALLDGDLDGARRYLSEALRSARECGYGLYWVDLHVIRGYWELACGRQLQQGKELSPELEIWTPRQWFERAESSALRALNGQLKDSDEPAPQPDLPEDQLAMLGARHPECGYAWGEGDALHLLGEALLALAHCVGSHGHDSKGRSHRELLEKARQAAEAALALRKRIQDPQAKDTQDLLSKIEEAQGGDGP
jgi:tetratricopeptide (TPR) repeat protein